MSDYSDFDLQALLDAQGGYDQPSYDTGSPDISWFLNNTDFSGLDSTGQESSYDDLTQLLNQDSYDTSSLSSLLDSSYPMSIGAAYEAPGALSLWQKDLNPAQSYRLPDGTVVGMSADGADVQNPYDYLQGPDGQTYVIDTNTKKVVGLLDDKFNVDSLQDIQREKQAASPQDKDYGSLLKNLLQKQAYDKLKAQENYSNSGVGKALSGLGMAALLAKTLTGKNQAPKVSARGNVAQAFAPTYQGSSAPKTKYAKGGGVEAKGGLLNMAEQMAAMIADQKGLIPGKAGGQDDVVDIKAAPGEYVMDAEVVSALGDGNNEEGARKLDQMRMNVRKHKRTGGLSSIPPKAKKPEQYMKKGK